MKVLTAAGYQTVRMRGFLDDVAYAGPFSLAGQGQVPLASKPTGELMWASYSDIYRHNPWVYGAVQTLIRGLASLPLRAYQFLPDGDRQQVRGDLNVTPGPLSDAQRLANLLRLPRIRTSRNRMARRLFWDIFVKGNALLEKERDPATGKVIALRYWPWRYTLPVRAAQFGLVYGGTGTGLGPILHFVVQEAPTWTWRIIQLQDLIHFHWGDSEDGELGVSPLEAVASAHGLQNAMNRQLKSWFQNSASPSLHVKVAKKPTDQEERWLRDSFTRDYGGPENAGNVIFSTGDPTPLSTAPSHNAVVEITQITREEVFAAYSMPPVLMGVLEKAALGNVKELRSFYLRDLVGPHASTFTDELDAQLVNDVAEPNWAGMFCDFDMDARLRPDLEALVAAHKLMIAGQMETPNEARMDLNKPQVDDPEADELWAPVNMAPIGKASAKKQQPISSPKAAPPGEGSVLLPGEPAPDEGSLGLGEPATNGKAKA
jgi:HK97 family phage portal protein